MHLYVIQVEAERRRFIFDNLRQLKIGVNVHYIPVHTQPYFQNLGFKVGDFPNAESYYEEAISLPLYPTMSHLQQDKVVTALNEALML